MSCVYVDTVVHCERRERVCVCGEGAHVCEVSKALSNRVILRVGGVKSSRHMCASLPATTGRCSEQVGHDQHAVDAGSGDSYTGTGAAGAPPRQGRAAVSVSEGAAGVSLAVAGAGASLAVAGAGAPGPLAPTHIDPPL